LEPDKTRARALNNAYALLRQRPRSDAEIRDRLKLKGYDAAVIDNIVGLLTKAGHINDAKFARMWVESRMRSNPMGDIVLRRELKDKGVSESIVEAALAHKKSEYDEHSIALEMAKERFARLKKIDRRKAIKRVYDFLLRRGFRFDLVRDIIEELGRGCDDR
jgi:regulatory protein